MDSMVLVLIALGLVVVTVGVVVALVLLLRRTPPPPDVCEMPVDEQCRCREQAHPVVPPSTGQTGSGVPW